MLCSVTMCCALSHSVVLCCGLSDSVVLCSHYAVLCCVGSLNAVLCCNCNAVLCSGARRVLCCVLSQYFVLHIASSWALSYFVVGCCVLLQCIVMFVSFCSAVWRDVYHVVCGVVLGCNALFCVVSLAGAAISIIFVATNTCL